MRMQHRFVFWGLVLAVSFTTWPPTAKADLARLVSGLGTTNLGQWTGGNFNGDGEMSLLDAALLQIHFGSIGPAPSAATVPEPTAWLPECVGALTLLTTRRSTRLARNSRNHL